MGGGSLSGGSLSKAVSVWRVSVQGVLCPAFSVQGVCLGGSLSGGSLSRESVSGGRLCSGESLSWRLLLRVGDTHPTGMHSCFYSAFTSIINVSYCIAIVQKIMNYIVLRHGVLEE